MVKKGIKARLENMTDHIAVNHAQPSSSAVGKLVHKRAAVHSLEGSAQQDAQGERLRQARVDKAKEDVESFREEYVAMKRSNKFCKIAKKSEEEEKVEKIFGYQKLWRAAWLSRLGRTPISHVVSRFKVGKSANVDVTLIDVPRISSVGPNRTTAGDGKIRPVALKWLPPPVVSTCTFPGDLRLIIGEPSRDFVVWSRSLTHIAPIFNVLPRCISSLRLAPNGQIPSIRLPDVNGDAMGMVLDLLLHKTSTYRHRAIPAIKKCRRDIVAILTESVDKAIDSLRKSDDTKPICIGRQDQSLL
ncbi:hypothetical protein B0T17DRAFT_603345 [Bombardia bombarda]|uniref:Uncharacterized protein n=1 Tax=Bombardia bombarda TaxID=252184 RepID=A0AA39U2Y9_9PEZI|nr:hypothetical protein B0T17DRAFT_603345 [Bombardia bombarda]